MKNKEIIIDSTLLEQPSKEKISKGSEMIEDKNENNNKLTKTPTNEEPSVGNKSNQKEIEKSETSEKSETTESKQVEKIDINQEPIITYQNNENQVADKQINEENFKNNSDQSSPDNSFNDMKPTSNSIVIPQASYEDENSILNNTEVDHEAKTETNDFESEKPIDIDQSKKNEELIENETEAPESLKKSIDEINKPEAIDLKKGIEEINKSELDVNSKNYGFKELYEADQINQLEAELVENNFYEKNFKKLDKEIEVLKVDDKKVAELDKKLRKLQGIEEQLIRELREVDSQKKNVIEKVVEIPNQIVKYVDRPVKTWKLEEERLRELEE